MGRPGAALNYQRPPRSRDPLIWVVFAVAGWTMLMCAGCLLATAWVPYGWLRATLTGLAVVWAAVLLAAAYLARWYR